MAARSWLDLAGIPYVVCQNQLVVPMASSSDLVNALNPGTCDVLPGGVIPTGDPPARQLAALLIESLLPRANGPRGVCVIGRPALGAGEQSGKRFEASYQFAAQLARLRGYRPVPMNPALALVLAEMARDNFTGLGLVLGASGCDLVLAQHGNQIAAERIDRGGAWLDAGLALALRLERFTGDGLRAWDLERAARLKESAWLTEGSPPEQQPLMTLYRQLLAEIAAAVARLLEACPMAANLPQPLALVYGGGAAQPAGFGALLYQALQSARGLIAQVEPRRSCASSYTIARGLLIWAEIEAQHAASCGGALQPAAA